MASLIRPTKAKALGMCLVALILLAILVGLTKERHTMGLTRNDPIPGGVIPPIDAAPPTSLETATFALG